MRPKFKGDYVRDEGERAWPLSAVLGRLGAEGVDGGFLDTFADPISPNTEGPRHGLDMASRALVPGYEGRKGSVNPD
ncbi:MAG: abortive infection protein, partial [Thermoplasmata archaeon]